MADFEREVTSANKTIPPYSNRVSFSFRAAGIRLTQSGGRLVVVNYFTRRVFIWLLCIMSIMFPLTWLPPFHFWISLFHHAALRAMLSVVLATNTQLVVDELVMLSLAAMFYWMLVISGDLNGIVLDRRNGTVKAAGRTRPLTDLEAVKVIATWVVGRPEPYPGWIVQLVWSVERKPSWWQLREQHKSLKISVLGIFIDPKDVADVEKLAQAVAEFAGVSVQHKIISKNSV